MARACGLHLHYTMSRQWYSAWTDRGVRKVTVDSGFGPPSTPADPSSGLCAAGITAHPAFDCACFVCRRTPAPRRVGPACCIPGGSSSCIRRGSGLPQLCGSPLTPTQHLRAVRGAAHCFTRFWGRSDFVAGGVLLTEAPAVCKPCVRCRPDSSRNAPEGASRLATPHLNPLKDGRALRGSLGGLSRNDSDGGNTERAHQWNSKRRQHDDGINECSAGRFARQGCKRLDDTTYRTNKHATQIIPTHSAHPQQSCRLINMLGCRTYLPSPNICRINQTIVATNKAS